MSNITIDAIIGEPEVLEDEVTAGSHRARRRRGGRSRVAPPRRSRPRSSAAAAGEGRPVPEEEPTDRREASALVDAIVESIEALAPSFPHEAACLAGIRARLPPVAGRGLRRTRLPRLARGVPASAAPHRRYPPPRGVPDGHPERVSPTGTSRRSSSRRSGPSSSPPSRRATTRTSCSSACGSWTSRPVTTRTRRCCSPRRSAMREIPPFTWGAIFQDREAARYRRVVRAASEITKLELPR